MDLTHVTYDRPASGSVAVVSLNRPDKANAQNLQLLYDLDSALNAATRDPEVKVRLLMNFLSERERA